MAVAVAQSFSRVIQPAQIVIPSLPVTHTGVSTWVKIDTTNLWVGHGGNAPTGSLLLIDGAEASTLYGGDFVGQPTPSAPIVAYLMTQNTHVFTLVPSSPGPPYTGSPYYETTMDVYWRGVFTFITDGTGTTNSTYFNGSWPADTNTPLAGNGWSDGPGYEDALILNNGYGMVLDGGGATSATFCVAPGDSMEAGTSADCRAEPDFADSYSLGTGRPVGCPTGGIDLNGNVSLNTQFIRFDYLIPSTWLAPVTVENASNSAWVAYLASEHPSILTWPNGTNKNPTNGLYNTATALVTNSSSAVTVLSNLWENQGPATFAFAVGTGGGANGAFLDVYQPTSLGVSMPVLQLDQINIAWDTRYSTIVEYKPDLCATGNGESWFVAAGVVTAPRVTPWSNTDAVAPFGVPLQSDNVTPNPPYGGGYFRIWRLISGSWSCRTAGTAYAVPGTPTIDAYGNIIGDPTYGADAGKIFGPTMKCQGTNVVSGPDGSSGVVLNAGTSPPFYIVCNGPVSGTGFDGGGGNMVIGDERFYYSQYNSGSKQFTVTQRALHGTTAANHSVGDQMAVMIEAQVISTGLNQNSGVPVPFAARQWPTLIGPTFASVFGTPTSSYP